MPTPLPIDAVLPELVAALRASPNAVLQAPTGAGKTTRVPPALLDDGLADRLVVMLEPRRLAARAAAARIADERGVELGKLVGYHVRFERRSHHNTRILVVTPGVLLRMLHDDPFLESISILLFDEFHERGIENDLALGLVKLIQQTVRPELRVVAMSATFDTSRVSKYLGDCPVVASEGRMFPVEVLHEAKPETLSCPDAVAAAVIRLLDRTDGDILAFLPGMGEIRRAGDCLDDVARRRDLLVLPLHGDLPLDQQEMALKPQTKRKVVLATNVAETSVTVEGVTGVVDSGLARVLVYDATVGLDRLELREISRASAAQRTGRAGRTRPGVCVRLWDAMNHRTRPEQTAPEVMRVDLAGAALQLLCLGENDVASFPWLDPPSSSAIEHALLLLRRLGAVDARGVTNLGRSMARMPTHPRLARMLIEAAEHGHADRVSLACALLAERDPFLREPGMTLPRRGPTSSDILDRVRAVEDFERHGRTDSPFGSVNRNAARFLLRSRDQLVRSLREEVQLPEHAPDEAEDEAVMRALLAGFPDRLAKRREAGGRTGVMVGGRGVRLAPQSAMVESELFVCVDTDAGDRESLVRQASAVDRGWLPRANLSTRVEVEFDDSAGRVVARKRTRFEDLVLEESPVPLADAGETSRILTEAALRDIDRVLPNEKSEARNLLLRIRCLKEWLPELGLPAFEGEDFREVLAWLAPGCRSFDDLRKADWFRAIEGRLSREQRAAVERDAPERIAVPSGSRIAVGYEPGKPPVLAVRIQEVFGLEDTPRIAGGRVKVVMHLLAPNYRPQQVTDDLASFWENTYPLVRKELRARYPKHSWPEDPYAAEAMSRPRRKKPDAP